MVTVGIIGIIGLIAAAVLGSVLGKGKAAFPMSCGYPYFLLRRAVLRKCGLWEREENYNRELYVNRDYEAVGTEDSCREGLVIGGILLGFWLLILIFAFTGAFSRTEITAVTRPSGGTAVTKLLADCRDETVELDFSVSERKLTEEELAEVLSAARESLPADILGENASLSQVTDDLVLSDTLPGTSVSVSWYSSDYRVLSSDGSVYPEQMEKESENVTLTARITYGTHEEEWEIPVTVIRKTEEGAAFSESLTTALSDAEKSQSYSETVELPETVDGERVHFFKEAAENPGLLVLLLLLIVAAVLATNGERKKKALEERKKQMLSDYPEVVSKLTLLMEAGLTIRGAWERILSDYERYIRVHGRRYAYEEMLRTRKSLLIGVPEEQAYEEYGKNCGLVRYLRFSSILVQNLRKGTGSIIPLLQKEAEEAAFSRKEQARQLGEEAGTKLLLPMIGMLVVVLVIVLVPAFMAF